MTTTARSSAWAIALSLGLLAAAATAAMARPSAPTAEDIAGRTTACTVEELAELTSWGERIAEAETVDEARELALKPTRMARRALGMATWVAPGADTLAVAQGRLERYEARVASAATPAEVAGEFSALTVTTPAGAAGQGAPMQMADLQVGEADVSGPGGCHYTTGEIIAIVIGFLLFIIPGIILLIVLC